MEYDATALKKLIGRGKAGNVYIGRSFSLTWAGGMFTYDNKMYPIPAAMQPINEFMELRAMSKTSTRAAGTCLESGGSLPPGLDILNGSVHI